jgi:hypothetical protein
MECGRGVSEAEEHNSGFKESSVGFEGGFPFVASLDAYIVVSSMDIEFGVPCFLYRIAD